jgi:2-alkyl-3-oxoalkanoate reductase
VDSVYVDNAADAHVLAADRLEPESEVAGKAYFITQGEPLPLADLINRILQAGGLPPCEKRIPAGFAYVLGAVLEDVYGILGLESEPPMTRFVARQLSTAHWFDISAARGDLGYAPTISLDEGMKRLAESLRG